METMYYHLFNAITDALEELAQRNYGRAAELLKAAQRDGEELYLGREKSGKDF